MQRKNGGKRKFSAETFSFSKDSWQALKLHLPFKECFIGLMLFVTLSRSDKQLQNQSGLWCSSDVRNSHWQQQHNFAISLQQTCTLDIFFNHLYVEPFANCHQLVTENLLDSSSPNCILSELESDWLSFEYSGLKLKVSSLNFLQTPFFFAQFLLGPGHGSALLHHNSRWRRLGNSKGQKRKTNGLALALWTKLQLLNPQTVIWKR